MLSADAQIIVRPSDFFVVGLPSDGRFESFFAAVILCGFVRFAYSIGTFTQNSLFSYRTLTVAARTLRVVSSTHRPVGVFTKAWITRIISAIILLGSCNKIAFLL